MRAAPRFQLTITPSSVAPIIASPHDSTSCASQTSRSPESAWPRPSASSLSASSGVSGFGLNLIGDSPLTRKANGRTFLEDNSCCTSCLDFSAILSIFLIPMLARRQVFVWKNEGLRLFPNELAPSADFYAPPVKAFDLRPRIWVKISEIGAPLLKNASAP